MINRAASICFSGTPGCELALDAPLEGGDKEVSFEAAFSHVCFCWVIPITVQTHIGSQHEYATHRRGALIRLYEVIRALRTA
jgi:hypothetical protein